jgi:Ca2+-binding RTX toxin-like protein
VRLRTAKRDGCAQPHQSQQAQDATFRRQAMTVINGTAAADNLVGSDTNDILRGFAGNDFLTGGLGADKMFGGAGNDTFVYTGFEQDGVYEDGEYVGPADVINGGAGFDRIESTDSFIDVGHAKIVSVEGVKFGPNNNHNSTIGIHASQLAEGKLATDLYVVGSSNNNTLLIRMEDATTLDASTLRFSSWQGLGSNARDLVFIEGDDNNETVKGSIKNDEFVMNGGNDKVRAGLGNDFIDGGTGNDTLNGGLGNDTLIGDAGNDRYIFNTKLDGLKNVDDVSFNPGEDHFLIDNAVFTGLANGPLSPDAFKNLAMGAVDADDRILFDDGKLYFDQDGSGAIAKVLFATVDAGVVLDATAFIVI